MFRENRRHLALCVAAAFALVSAASATTIIAKSFRSMAVEATGVFSGVVTDVRAYRRGEDGPIWTAVRFGDVRWLAGAGGAEKELHFAGGRIGELAEVVGGMPQFTVDQRVLLFVHDAPTASPVVGFHQGCFALRATEEGDVVVTPDHRPVLAVDGDELVTGEPFQKGGVSVDAFADIVSEMRRGSVQP